MRLLLTKSGDKPREIENVKIITGAGRIKLDPLSAVEVEKIKPLHVPEEPIEAVWVNPTGDGRGSLRLTAISWTLDVVCQCREDQSQLAEIVQRDRREEFETTTEPTGQVSFNRVEKPNQMPTEGHIPDAELDERLAVAKVKPPKGASRTTKLELLAKHELVAA